MGAACGAAGSAGWSASDVATTVRRLQTASPLHGRTKWLFAAFSGPGIAPAAERAHRCTCPTTKLELARRLPAACRRHEAGGAALKRLTWSAKSYQTSCGCGSGTGKGRTSPKVLDSRAESHRPRFTQELWPDPEGRRSAVGKSAALPAERSGSCGGSSSSGSSCGALHGAGGADAPAIGTAAWGRSAGLIGAAWPAPAEGEAQHAGRGGGAAAQQQQGSPCPLSPSRPRVLLQGSPR